MQGVISGNENVPDIDLLKRAELLCTGAGYELQYSPLDSGLPPPEKWVIETVDQARELLLRFGYQIKEPKYHTA